MSRVTYSFPNLKPVRCSMSDSNCCFLTCIQVTQEIGKVVWYSYLFKNFPQFFVIHTVKGFSVVNEAEVGVFSGIPLLFLRSSECWQFDLVLLIYLTLWIDMLYSNSKFWGPILYWGNWEMEFFPAGSIYKDVTVSSNCSLHGWWVYRESDMTEQSHLTSILELTRWKFFQSEMYSMW